jgi:hypothetical protein
MKSLSIYIILIAAVSFLLIDREATAQSVETVEIVTAIEQTVDCSNISQANVGSINTIVEDDYPFLRNLDCLTNGDFHKKRGWNLKLRNVSGSADSYVLSGSGHNINVKATYDRDGNLIEGLLTKKNTTIPLAIRQFIASGEFEGWTMTGNEKVVKDFDPYQTEYNVTLSNGNKEKILSFKDQGNRLLFAGVIN